MKKIVQVSAIDITMNVLLGKLNQSIISEGYQLICICSPGSYTPKMINEGLDVRSIQIDRHLHPWKNLRSVIKMYRLFKQEKPDIVHVHTPIAAVLGRIAAKLAGVPHIIYTAHGFYFHENMRPLVYKSVVWIEKFMARYFTDYIFTQSEEDRQTAIKYKFIAEDRILTIGNGVNIWDKFNPARINKEEVERLYQEFKIEKGQKVITFIGRLVREKGIADLLDAFGRIDRSDVKLLVIGDPAQGERDENTPELIKKYNDDERVLFTGQRSDIANILYLSDIFCLPSYREGMPRSIIEAMAMHCAVVATNIRGSREEVVDGETGLLVPLAAPEELARAIQSLLDDEKTLTVMKERGRARAEQLYDEEKVVELQLNVFEQIL